MSDRLNRPDPGHDPLGDRLRAFGSQTAHTVSLPPVEEIHRGGDRRRRHQRVAVAAATLAVTAIIGGVVVASQLGTRGEEALLPATRTPTPTATTPEVTPTVTSTTSPSATVTPTSSPSTSASAVGTPSSSTPSTTPSSTRSGSVSPTAEPMDGRRVEVDATATLLLPQGWTSTADTRGMDHLDRPETYQSLCLNDGKANPPNVSCDVHVDVGAVLPGAEGQRVWEPGQVDGWYPSSGVELCPVPGGGASDWITLGVTPTKDFAKVGSKTAERYTYRHSCTSGRTFRATQYWLPASHIRVTDPFGHPRTADILASMRFGQG